MSENLPAEACPTKKRKLCEIEELEEQYRTLQFDIEYLQRLQRENAQLRAELGRNDGQIQALKTALTNLKADNEQQRAELGRKGGKIETLKQFIRRLRAECDTPALENLERVNRNLRAELRKDADEISRMRRSIRELRARVRGKHDKAVQRLAVLRGALNVLTDDNYLSVLSLHLSGNLQARIPGNRRRQVGEWVNEAYALWLQEKLNSGASTEELMSSGESTEEMDSGDST